jgi:quinoprotein glucose dehydrogenase
MDKVDYTPEIRRRALEIAQNANMFAPFFNPPTHVGDPAGPGRICPGDTGGVNITGPAVADPVEGVIFITSHSGCGSVTLAPGVESPLDGPEQTGVTHSDWARSRSGRGRGRGRGCGPPTSLDGLSVFKGPLGRISAIDLNTGEYLWVIPHGDAPEDQQERIRNHPLLQGVEGVQANQGRRGHSAMVATPTLLLASGQISDGTPNLFAIDKRTGERVGSVELPGGTRYGMSSWVHEGKQYVVIQLNDGLAVMGLPGS